MELIHQKDPKGIKLITTDKEHLAMQTMLIKLYLNPRPKSGGLLIFRTLVLVRSDIERLIHI
jgi:hypothetical protein